ncbi:beta-lactamase/transpeptidase-like protein [Sistotremastrum suecicum HHB10207 ss-3]|uniref:Beta-lactamase/transpeptidase-like protein n=1 Tax=Sistotremastrum suecicum HHB10207 ss-3 TaxID=1314776 RepID=A0A166FUH3_9AGAM|nr:beta-lactamase/transpeptidase-like protein [Sistotremastrum suecicum HHB10207 ss-3]
MFPDLVASSSLILSSLSSLFRWQALDVAYPGPNFISNPVAAPILGPEITTFIEEVREKWKAPGVTIAIVRPDGLEEYGGFGKSTEDGDEVDPDTLFSIGSCSKAFASASIGILIDDFAQGRNKTSLPPNLNKLDWTTKVADLFPDDWLLQDKWATESATLIDILTHLSGLPRHDMSYLRGDAPLANVRRLRHLAPTYGFREKWQYNNIMYIVASDIITRYSTVNYTSFVEERIFKPLNMSRSSFSEYEAITKGNFSQSWDGFTNRRIPYSFSAEDREVIAGPGGVISSAKDMAKWMQMLLNEGKNTATNATIISHSSFTTITGAHSIATSHPQWPDTSVTTYGLGWILDSYQGHNRVWHNGGLPGFSTLLHLYPDDGLGIFLSSNGNDKHAVLTAIAARIAEDVFGLSHIPWVNRYLASSTKNSTGSPPPTPELPSANNNSTSPSISQFEGTYYSAGYGNVTLCSQVSSSDECRKLYEEDFRGLLGPELHSDQTLLASYERMWCSHFYFARGTGLQCPSLSPCAT